MSHVRFAQKSDIPALIDLSRQMHVQSRYAWSVFSSSSVWRYLENAIPRKQFCVIVAYENDEPNAKLVGLLLAQVHAYPFGFDVAAHLEYLYVIPQKRGTPTAMKMMSAFRRWADNREVAEILILNTFENDKNYSAKLLNKLGIKPIGGVHSMWMERK